MIAPPPFKLKCPQCGYSKVVKLKSDVIMDIAQLSTTCPKCGAEMEKVPLGFLDKLLKGL